MNKKNSSLSYSSPEFIIPVEWVIWLVYSRLQTDFVPNKNKDCVKRQADQSHSQGLVLSQVKFGRNGKTETFESEKQELFISYNRVRLSLAWVQLHSIFHLFNKNISNC